MNTSYLPDHWSQGLLPQSADRTLLTEKDSSVTLTVYRRRDTTDGELPAIRPDDARTTGHFAVQVIQIIDEEEVCWTWYTAVYHEEQRLLAAACSTVEVIIGKTIKAMLKTDDAPSGVEMDEEMQEQRSVLGQYMGRKMGDHLQERSLQGKVVRTRDLTPLHLQKTILGRIQAGDRDPAAVMESPEANRPRTFLEALCDELGDPAEKKRKTVEADPA